jgi:hypothetical protein
MQEISFGNMLTIVTIIVGLIIQYVAIITKFSERIAKLEAKYDMLKEGLTKSDDKLTKDIGKLFTLTNDIVKNCEHVRD